MTANTQGHNVHDSGDFWDCTNPGCRWGATWSMGHICNTCGKQAYGQCKCKCPLTEKDKLRIMKKRANKGELDFGTFNLYFLEKKPDGFDKVSTAYRYGKRQEIIRLYDYAKKYGPEKLIELLRDKVQGFKAGYEEVD